jgi:hypothetical protein
MKVLKELTIVVPNKPGALARVLRAAARRRVNLRAVQSSAGYDLSMVRFVVEDAPAFRKVLRRLGHPVTETSVLALELADSPGRLAAVASALARARVNINYLYATSSGGPRALVALHVSDPERARRALARAR